MTAAKNAGTGNYLWLGALVAAGQLPDFFLFVDPEVYRVDPIVPLFNAFLDFTVLLLVHETVKDTPYRINVIVMALQCVYVSVHLGAFYVRAMFQFSALDIYVVLINAYQPVLYGLFAAKWLALIGGAGGVYSDIARRARDRAWLRHDLRHAMPRDTIDRRQGEATNHQAPPTQST